MEKSKLLDVEGNPVELSSFKGTYKLTASLGNQRDLSILVDTICEKLGKNTKNVRDKFKMVNTPTLDSICQMCDMFLLDVEITNKTKRRLIHIILDEKSKNRSNSNLKVKEKALLNESINLLSGEPLKDNKEESDKVKESEKPKDIEFDEDDPFA